MNILNQGPQLESAFRSSFSLMEQNYNSRDLEKRAWSRHEAERIAMEDMPLTPINYYVSKTLVKPFVRGFRDNVRGINRSHYVSVNRD